MGVVYQVRHLISDRIEAMKVLLPDFESNPALAERFVREIRLQASLSHPHIASLHNALRFENQLLMVMEFVDGRTLSELIRGGQQIDLARALQITIQVLSALEYAHSRGVIHRDVKPSNVMITPEGVAKLMDFGIARAVMPGFLVAAERSLDQRQLDVARFGFREHRLHVFDGAIDIECDRSGGAASEH